MNKTARDFFWFYFPMKVARGHVLSRGPLPLNDSLDTQYLWSYLIKNNIGHKEMNNCQPEIRIMKGEL